MPRFNIGDTVYCEMDRGTIIDITYDKMKYNGRIYTYKQLHIQFESNGFTIFDKDNVRDCKLSKRPPSKMKRVLYA